MISIANYCIAALTVTITAISVGISQGMTNFAAIKAIDIQPQAHNHIRKVALVSSALIETAAILGLFISILLFLDGATPVHFFYSECAKIGIGFAIICAAFIVGIVSAWPAQAACYAIARQPLFGQWIFNFTLIVLSIIQTPLILAFIVALIIKNQAYAADSLAQSLRLIGAGISIGVGSIGPSLGLAHFARTACTAVGTNRTAASRILTFTFISQAVIESPIIFAMVTALVLLFKDISVANPITGIALLAGGIATGIGMFGPGFSSGRTAAAACKQIAITPELYPTLVRTSIFAQGIIDTAAIYILVFSLMTAFIG